MSIAPISMININSLGSVNHKKPKISFTHKGIEENNESYGFLALLVASAGLLGMAFGSEITRDKYQDKLINTAENLAKSPEIKKDTFTVKDINGDKTPELILYKKDGSKVAIDIRSGELLEERKEWKTIE